MIDRFVATITPLRRRRTVRVYLPPGYEAADERHPVLYMHDGQNLFRDGDASFGVSWGVADHLDASGRPLIVVGIDSPRDERRIDEYAPWENRAVAKEFHARTSVGIGGQGAAYVDWIARELKPAIDRRYRTDPDATAMAGSSLGGLISTYAACAYPDLFRSIAALSSAYWFNQTEIEDRIRATDLTGIERFYLDVGTVESSERAEAERYVRSNVAVHALLRERVRQVRFEIVEGGEHHESAWRRRVPDVLAFLFG